MTMIAEGAGVARDRGAEKQHVTVALSQLAFEALTGDGGEAAAPARMESAMRCYLGDKETGGRAWPYPDFLRGSESQRDARVELEVPAELWDAFSEETAKQGVSLDQLAEHAAFYFAAELDAGRVTQRILEDLEATEGASGED